MKRRTFLQQAGAVLTGTTVAAAAEGEQPHPKGKTQQTQRPTVVLTSPESRLGKALAAALGKQYTLRLADGPLFRDENGALERLLEDVDAIVHLSQPADAERASDLLDRRGRGTYDLLTVAAAKGVGLVVYLSSLEIMAGYDPSFQVAEDWRPVPTPQPEQLSHYLAECACREFARERKLRAIVLRLGEVVPVEALHANPAEPPWVAQTDAVAAVRLALETQLGESGAAMPSWNVLHIAADVPGGRFPVARAKRMLGYQPQVHPTS